MRMAGGISIHVVDVSRGVVARGMRVEVWRFAAGHAQVRTGSPAALPAERLADDEIDASGALPAPVLMTDAIGAGRYEVRFHVAAFYRSQAVPLPAEPFLDVVHYGFGIDDAAQHYHLPMKTTPWGYSCFRGGA
jgi:5-hydroxyisourate hydrolase